MQDAPRWTFLTNHAHVLLCIARDPEMLLKHVAERVGITERATQRIVADLVADEYLSISRVGRRNHYQVNANKPFRHPVEHEHQVGVLLKVLRRESREFSQKTAISAARA